MANENVKATEEKKGRKPATPGENPEVSQKEAPPENPEKNPEASPKEAPPENPEKNPEASPKEAPPENPEKNPEVSPKEAPPETPNETPEGKAEGSLEGSLEGRIEAVLFVAGDAIRKKDLAGVLSITEKKLESILTRMSDDYDYNQRGFMIRRFGEKVQLATRPLYAPDVVRLLQPVQQQSLSQAAMETLAVVAYKQPVTRSEVEQIRGVKCDYSLQSLSTKGLIQEVGRKDTIGHPILFGTTDAFLSHFGLESLEDLPPMPEEAGKAGDTGAEDAGTASEEEELTY
ncbi:MAG: SMC-Scp complex subunit ScpB [Clostridia bacterium]|nr:SMC-Scp complex subunit ScpB [Clostridia bacterium]